MTAAPKYAILLDGPIGAGKSTLGRALGEALGGGFIDGDDHADPTKPWYGSILQTSRSIVATGLAVLDRRPAVVIAYPLACINWIYFRRKFGDAGIPVMTIGLRASFAGITARTRGRSFDEEEKRRIAVMIAEGYGARPFSDAVIDTDRDSFEEALVRLVSETRRMMRGGGGRGQV